ncbi:MAG TPA: carboxypeptidase regulatory-like domain-containing protein [Bryobacteraceae bacterium]|jgi:tetratricopeptide (TPR) repeat protein
MRPPIVRKSAKLAAILPVFLLFAAAAVAQTASIEGDVKGEDGKPVVGAIIKIDQLDIKGSYKVKTDKKGHYFQGGLRIAGTFLVTVEVNGKDVDQINGVRPNGGSPADVNFDLKAAAARAAAAAAANPNGGAPGGAAAAPEPEKGMTPAQKAEFERKKKEAEAQMAKNAELNDAFNAGMQAETAKMWDAAIEAFTKAAALGPTQHVIFSHLGDAYGGRGDKETGAEQQADYDKGIEAYKKALELSPMDPAYHNNYALILVKRKMMDEALAELNKAATLDPMSAGKYYYNLGAVLANVNQADAAGDAFKKATASDPPYVEAYYQYGLVLVGKATVAADGKVQPPAGTVEALQKYLELAPTGPNAQAAKDLLTTLGGSIETGFEKPGAKKAPANKKK